jgi:arsenite methyltransferase
MVKYDEEAAREIERSYITPEVAQQRIRTLEGLALQSGEHVLDAGCGTGFLAQELAMVVGPEGCVVGIDNSLDMLERAKKRCMGLSQVQLKHGSVEDLPEQEESFDAVTCIQVLMYLPQVSKALAEMHRVLKRGGRIAVIETDWRGVVLNSSDDALSRRMLAAWDDAVPSPNLPVQLGLLLRSEGFTAIRVVAIPILNTSYTPDNFAVGALEWIAHYAKKQGAVSEGDTAAWLNDLRNLGERGTFFFCVNRFLFTAVKV